MLSTEEADQRCLWHPFTQMKSWCDPENPPLVIERGEGAWLIDNKCRRYLDGNASIWTNIHGHNHPAINAAIRDQLGKIAHVSFLGTTHEPAARLAENLVGLFPKGTLSRVFLSGDGSCAVEAALKMAFQYWQLAGQPKRTRFVAFDGAYHGDTTGASSLGGLGTFTERFSHLHFPVVRVSSADDLARLSEPQTVAAVFIEPLAQGAAGLQLWPPGMLRALRDWCDDTGALLVLDEVLTGFGRTGRMFACEHEAVVPDLVALGKGLSGGYLALSATLATERIFEAFLGDPAELRTFYHGHSYSGNPLACAAALASLRIFQEDDVLASLPPKIREMNRILTRLAEKPAVKAVRQCGMMAAIDLQAPGGLPLDWRHLTGARLCFSARRFGLLTRPVLDTILLIPPLCVSPEEMRHAGNALESAMDEVCR